MKNLVKFLTIVIIGLVFSATMSAQDTESATATAVIITPITITKTADMDFGSVAVSSVSSGTVILTAATGLRTTSGGITIPASVAASFSLATFDIEGSGALTYSITLPGSHTITRLTGSETMTVNGFNSIPSGTGTLTAGYQELVVGAVLNVDAGEVAGTYTNASGFDVTVNYN